MHTTRRQFVQHAAAATAALGAAPWVHAQNKPIRVGMLLTLSGPYAGTGDLYGRGMQIAINEFNKAGGLKGRLVEGVRRDDKFNGPGAIAAVREFAGEGINLVMSAGGSVSTLAVAPLLKELNMLFVNGGAAAMAIRHEAFVRNMFSTVANVYVQYGGLGRAMAEQGADITKWALIVPDSSFGRDSYKLFVAALRKHHPKAASLDIRAPILVSGSQTDFRAQINSLMSSDVQGVYMGAVGGPAASFFQQARSVGLDRKLKMICEGSGDQTARTLGKDMPASFWGPIFWPPNPNKPDVQAFRKALVETGDPSPISISNLGYRAAQGLLAGLKKANSTDTEALITAMEGLAFDTLNGPYRFRERDHQAVGTTFFAQYVSTDTPPYYAVKATKAVSDETVIETPSPGAEYVI